VAQSTGNLLREWRRRRRRSQLELAGEADLSTRHLSFIESGRALPSREMLARLAEQLAIPLRERNRLFLAAGYAPLHPERALDAPDMAAVRSAVDAVLSGHMPFPALAVDRHWTLIAANAAVNSLLQGVDAALLAPPVNVLRLSLHAQGLAPRIANLAEWRHHLLARLRAQRDDAGDPALHALYAELVSMPTPLSSRPPRPPNPVAVPFELIEPRSGRLLSFLSTTTVFGTATDVALAELSLECFYPADEATRLFLQQRN
jgi:DNA-binding XRE family transcriptional regulator